MSLDLSESSLTDLAALRLRLTVGLSELDVGGQLAHVRARHTNVDQRNWNFLPPFANSDNPFIYQQALNETFGSFHDSSNELNGAGFASFGSRLGCLRFTQGFRWEYFSNLSGKPPLSLRTALTLGVGADRQVEFFAGTFAENPVNNILEPYQVLIRADLERLRPIRHTLVSATYTHGPLRLSLYDKAMTAVPVVTPDFVHAPTKTRKIGREFIGMTSSGQARFRGGSVTFKLDRLIARSFQAEVAYAYCSAYRVDHGVGIDHSLEAPHRLCCRLDWQATQRLRLGAGLNIRSGYPYTPSQTSLDISTPDPYQPNYYRAAIGQENTSRFPLNSSLALNAEYCFGSAILFASIANVTNRANPIINSAGGYIYDAGILPNLGVRISF
jgi:hypothetical protein